MSLPIFWNKQAQVTFDLILDHIDRTWGERETIKFFNDAQNLLTTNLAKMGDGGLYYSSLFTKFIRCYIGSALISRFLKPANPCCG